MVKQTTKQDSTSRGKTKATLARKTPATTTGEPGSAVSPVSVHEAMLRRSLSFGAAQAASTDLAQASAILARAAATSAVSELGAVRALSVAARAEEALTDQGALLEYALALLDLFMELKQILPPSDPIITKVHRDYLDTLNRVNNMPEEAAIQPVEPARAERIKTQLAELQRARAASAAAEELLKIATELAAEFG